jgi:hypothetical protein
MRVRFKNRSGYDRWADIEEVIMLIRLDGTVVTSLPDAYCNERLLAPEEADKAIEFLNQEKGENPI